MVTIKKLVYSLVYLPLMLGVLYSCDNSMEDPSLQVQSSEVESTEMYQTQSAQGSRVSDLTGWNLVIDQGKSYGFKLYEKDGNYLQKVNLQSGAYLSVWTTRATANKDLPSSPLFPRTSMQTFWNKKPSKTLSVTNCQFFIPQDNTDTGTKPCPLAYPVKNSGSVLSTGSANEDQIPKRKLGISTSTKEAWMASYSNTSNVSSDVSSSLQSPTVIVGTDPFLDTQRKADYKIGRTMMGIKDQNGDGKKEVIYILTGNYKQPDAVSILTSLGCLPSDIMMLDGHFSAQMMAEGVDYYSSLFFAGTSVKKSRRNVPCVIYVRHK